MYHGLTHAELLIFLWLCFHVISYFPFPSFLVLLVPRFPQHPSRTSNSSGTCPLLMCMRKLHVKKILLLALHEKLFCSSSCMHSATGDKCFGDATVQLKARVREIRACGNAWLTRVDQKLGSP